MSSPADGRQPTPPRRSDEHIATRNEMRNSAQFSCDGCEAADEKTPLVMIPNNGFFLRIGLCRLQQLPIFNIEPLTIDAHLVALPLILQSSSLRKRASEPL